MRFLFFIAFLFTSNFLFSQTWQELQKQAQTAYERGQYEKSISIGNQAKTIAQKSSSNYKKLAYGRLFTYLGLSYQATKDLENALSHHRESARLALKYYGGKHYLYGSRLINIGIVLRYLGKPEGAQDTLEKALPIVAKHWGTSNAIYRNGIIHCAKACLANDNLSKGESYYLEAEKVYAAQKLPFPASASIDLANLYHSQNRYEDIIVYLEKSLMDISSSQKHHESILNIMNALSLFYSEQKNYEKLWTIFQICDKREVEGRIIFLEDYINTALDDEGFEQNEFIFDKWQLYSKLYNKSEHRQSHVLVSNLRQMFQQYEVEQIEKVFNLTNFNRDSSVIMYRLELQGNLANIKEDYSAAADHFKQALQYQEGFFTDEAIYRNWEPTIILKIKIQKALRNSEAYEEGFEFLLNAIFDVLGPENQGDASFFFKENYKSEDNLIKEFDVWASQEDLWNHGKKLIKSYSRSHRNELGLFVDYLSKYGYSTSSSKLRKETR